MPNEPTAGVDRRARKILFDTYWTSSGRRDQRERSTLPQDFEYAKRAGVMFDAIRLSHDDLVARALSAVARVDRTAVADAFVASLSSRRLELRSPLGSFAVLQDFPRHDAPAERGECSVCGAYNRTCGILGTAEHPWLSAAVCPQRGARTADAPLC